MSDEYKKQRDALRAENERLRAGIKQVRSLMLSWACNATNTYEMIEGIDGILRQLTKDVNDLKARDE